MTKITGSNIFAKDLPDVDARLLDIWSSTNLLFIGKGISKYKSKIREINNSPRNTNHVSLLFDTNNDANDLGNNGFEVLHSPHKEYSISLTGAEELSNKTPFTVVNFIDKDKKEECFNLLSNAAYLFDNTEEVVKDYLKIEAVVNVIISNEERIEDNELSCACSSVPPYSKYLTLNTYNVISLIVSESDLRQGLVATLNLVCEGLQQENIAIFKNQQLVQMNVQREHGRLVLGTVKI